MQLVHVLNAHLGNDWGQIRVRPNIGAMLGQRQFRQSPGHALNAHSGNDWGQIPLLSGTRGRSKLQANIHSTLFFKTTSVSIVMFLKWISYILLSLVLDRATPLQWGS